MKTRWTDGAVLVVVTLVGLASWMALQAEEVNEIKKESGPTAAGPEEKSPGADAVQPKPLGDQVKKGLEYLVNQQHPDGGWGQGGGWRVGNQGGRVEGQQVADPPDVGNTCIALLALIRAGNTPQEGPYAKNVAKAVEFLTGHIDQADDESLHVTTIRGTQLQSKIGQYVDTFLAALVLSELKGKMSDEKSEQRLLASLTKTIGKIEKHQKEDGTFAGNTGWAAVLSQGLAGKALNRANQLGVQVTQKALERDVDGVVAQLDQAKGEFKPAAGPVAARAGGVGGLRGVGLGAGGKADAAAAPSDAGIDLYRFSANAGRLQERLNSAFEEEKQAQKVLGSEEAPAHAKADARRQLHRISELKTANAAAVSGVVRKLDDKAFVAGFGNNGGEEFLSFMNLSETLRVRGGAEWEKWDKAVSENLTRVQNADGSWSGHHCITGRTFCTATALLTLMADRAPLPVAPREEGDQQNQDGK